MLARAVVSTPLGPRTTSLSLPPTAQKWDTTAAGLDSDRPDAGMQVLEFCPVLPV